MRADVVDTHTHTLTNTALACDMACFPSGARKSAEPAVDRAAARPVVHTSGF